jgi:hypothetical protein
MNFKNTIINALLIASSAFIITGCEKALDNSVPEGTPRRSVYNDELKNIITNDSIWITQKLDKGTLKFKVGFDFKKDESVRLFNLRYSTLTLIEEATLAMNTFTSPAERAELNSLINAISGLTDVSARNAIITNPGNISFLNRFQRFFPVNLVGPDGAVIVTEGSNTYDVFGDFETSLTFLNSSFLSDLKVSRNFDFDFRVTKSHRDSVEIRGHYTQNANRNAILKPIATTSLNAHVDFINMLRVLPFLVDIKINNAIVANETIKTLNTNFSEIYDQNNKSLAFKVNSGVTLATAWNNINTLKVVSTNYKIGAAKPVVGTVIANLKAYNNSTSTGINNAIDVQIVVK